MDWQFMKELRTGDGLEVLEGLSHYKEVLFSFPNLYDSPKGTWG